MSINFKSTEMCSVLRWDKLKVAGLLSASLRSSSSITNLAFLLFHILCSEGTALKLGL